MNHNLGLKVWNGRRPITGRTMSVPMLRGGCTDGSSRPEGGSLNSATRDWYRISPGLGCVDIESRRASCGEVTLA